jgi:hypothetical protein
VRLFVDSCGTLAIAEDTSMARPEGAGYLVFLLFVCCSLLAILAFAPEIRRWLGDERVTNPTLPARSRPW